MAITTLAKNQSSSALQEVENDASLSPECKELLLSLPKEKGWRTQYLYQYQGFWCQPKEIQSIISFQNHFKSLHPDDVILASIPKSGTTWLKALAVAVLNRGSYNFDDENHPLLNSNPHDLVPFFEYKIYSNNQIPNLSESHYDHLFATHIPFPSLPEPIRTSDCRIVYICRNPLDTFVSSWHFSKVKAENLSLNEAFKMYCKGIVGFGPFWEHMIGYLKESERRPEKVLFLTYEGMKRDVVGNVRRLANFLGRPLTGEEEKRGVAEGIARLCSFEKMKNLEVNKSKKSILDWENMYLFRKGEVGDWVNYLSPEMAEELTKVVEEKLGGTGLDFRIL